MPRTMEKTVYKLAELSEPAKEKARGWFRGIDEFDHESVYEDAAKCAEILGINLRQKPVRLMGGGTRYDPAIYYSGFYSQGDGACFEGTYSYAKQAPKKIREYAPDDSELHRIADELQTLQRKSFYRLTAVTAHRGHYYHSISMSVDVDGAPDVATEEALTELLRDFANWIWRQLRAEYEFRASDESVDESIEANEYEFTEDGSIAR